MHVKTLVLAALFCYSFSASAQYFDTLHLQYGIGVHTLAPLQMQALDSLVRNHGGKKLLIYSYADYLGSEKPNQHLSDRRAFAVRAYLLEKGMEASRIMECTGLGQQPGSGNSQGDPRSRRTDIFIRRDPSPATRAPLVPAAPGAPAASDTPVNITRIDLDRLKVGDALRMDNIIFYLGRPDILPSSYPELDNLYQTLHTHPGLKIRLEGHVCCCIYPDGFVEGTPTWNLSVDRALTVYRYLIGKGIAPERLQYQGFGRTRPIRDNERTAEEGAINRRVEVRILEL